MAKSGFVVPAFPVVAFSDAVVSGGETVADALTKIESVKDQVRMVYSQYTDMLIASGTVPKDETGRKAIRKAITEGIKTAVTEDGERGGALGDILASELIFKKATLSQYVTGVVLCYMNSTPWRANAANTVEQGGETRPAWWKTSETPDAPEKPSEIETVSQDTLRIELAQAVAHCRALGFVELAEAIFDAIIASPLKPVPPVSQ